MSLDFKHNLDETWGDIIITGVNQKPAYKRDDFQFPVYKEAGKELVAVRESFGNLEAGRIFVTPSYDLFHFRGILHVVCEGLSEDELLDSYRRALIHATELECTEVTVCYYGGGLHKVIKLLYEFLETSDIHICFYHYASLFTETAEELQLIEEISGVKEKCKYFPESPEYDTSKPKIRYHIPQARISESERLQKLYEAVGERMKELDKGREETFSQMLLRLIDESGKTDAEIYHKADIDRRHFSKIRNNKKYAPSKNTVLSLALALQLNLDNTELLLFKAGFGLNKSSYADEIIRLCIEHGFYDIHEINILLFKYHEETL